MGLYSRERERERVREKEREKERVKRKREIEIEVEIRDRDRERERDRILIQFHKNQIENEFRLLDVENRAALFTNIAYNIVDRVNNLA